MLDPDPADQNECGSRSRTLHGTFLRRKCWSVEWRRYHAADSPFPRFKLTLHVGEYVCFTIGGITFRLFKRNGAIGLSFLRWISSCFSNLYLFWKFNAPSGTRTLRLFCLAKSSGTSQVSFSSLFCISRLCSLNSSGASSRPSHRGFSLIGG